MRRPWVGPVRENRTRGVTTEAESMATAPIDSIAIAVLEMQASEWPPDAFRKGRSAPIALVADSFAVAWCSPTFDRRSNGGCRSPDPYGHRA